MTKYKDKITLKQKKKQQKFETFFDKENISQNVSTYCQLRYHYVYPDGCVYGVNLVNIRDTQDIFHDHALVFHYGTSLKKDTEGGRNVSEVYGTYNVINSHNFIRTRWLYSYTKDIVINECICTIYGPYIPKCTTRTIRVSYESSRSILSVSLCIVTVVFM